MNRNRKPPNERQMAVLRDAELFRVITNRSMAERHFRCLANGTVKALSRMVRRQLLVRHDLGQSMSYYTLGPQSWDYLGSPEEPVTYGPTQLEQDLASLDYCSFGPRQLDRLHWREIQNYFGELPQRESRAPWYLDPMDYLGRLRLVPIHKPIRKVIRETHQFLDQLRGYGKTISDLLERGGLLLVLMSLTEHRARSIKEALLAEDWRLRPSWQPVPIRSHAIPQPKRRKVNSKA